MIIIKSLSYIFAAMLIGYLIGSINPAIIITSMAGYNIKKYGSGNPGATNVLRAMGKVAAFIVFLIDFFKGFLVVWLCAYLSKKYCPGLYTYISLLSGISVILGHNFPVYYGFKGGKGVATSGGVIFAFDYRVGIILLLIVIFVIAATRYVSLASILAGIALPFIMVFFHRSDMELLLGCMAITCLLVYRHKENLKRLLSGKESKIKFK